MNANDECPFCKNGTLEKNGEDLVCRGECGILVSAEFQLGYNVGHSAGRRSHPASRSFMQSLQHEVALIAAALENPGDLTDAELVQVIGDAGDLAADLEKEIEEMRKAVKKWYDDLNAGEGKEALAGASEEEFKCAVAVVHSRTYGVSSGDTGEGYFRALLPLADLLNHGGDEYIDETRSSTSTVSTETVAWSEITDEEDESEIAFSAQKTLEPGEEALMSYGERSNDHFLLYYGFVPRKNPHDDVIIFENFDSAMMWHAMCFDEFWRREDIAIREQNAVRAYKETSKMLRETSDGALIDAEPRLKVLSDGRVDARVLAAFAALYAGDSELANNQETDRESLNAARKDVALRCEQLIQTVQKQSGKGEAEEMFSEDSSNKSRNKNNNNNNNNNNNSNNTNKNNSNDIENVVDAFRRHKMFILRDCVRKLSVAL